MPGKKSSSAGRDKIIAAGAKKALRARFKASAVQRQIIGERKSQERQAKRNRGVHIPG